MKKIVHTLSKMAIRLSTGTALALLAFFAYAFIANSSAETKAINFCSAFPVGSKSTVEAILSDAALKNADKKSSYKREDTEDTIAMWRGAFMERWYCNISIKNGKVTENRINYLD